jgi:hypothetical protein
VTAGVSDRDYHKVKEMLDDIQQNATDFADSMRTAKRQHKDYLAKRKNTASLRHGKKTSETKWSLRKKPKSI